MRAPDRYVKIVKWTAKDGCCLGTCPGLAFGGVHGNNEQAVYAELCEVVEEWIQIQAGDRAKKRVRRTR